MPRKSRRHARRSSGSPYFFRRVWSPFGSAVGAVRSTADIGLGLVKDTTGRALGAVDSAGYAVASKLNDGVGGLVGPARRRSTRRNRNRSSRNRNRSSRNKSRRNRH
jgi:hypothetical protein